MSAKHNVLQCAYSALQLVFEMWQLHAWFNVFSQCFFNLSVHAKTTSALKPQTTCRKDVESQWSNPHHYNLLEPHYEQAYATLLVHRCLAMDNQSSMTKHTHKINRIFVCTVRDIHRTGFIRYTLEKIKGSENCLK